MGKYPVEKTGRASDFVLGPGTPSPREMDPSVLARRMKQIEYGKNTTEYAEYSTAISREDRLPHHPKTPNMNRKYSRRAWDGLIRLWRCKLHLWDSSPDDATLKMVTRSGQRLNDSFSSTSTSSSALLSEEEKPDAFHFKSELEDTNQTVLEVKGKEQLKSFESSPRTSSPLPNVKTEERSWYEETLEYENEYNEYLQLHAEEEDLDMNLKVE